MVVWHMKKLLMIILLIPVVSFGETWDCVSKVTNKKETIKRNGNQINLLLDNDSVLDGGIEMQIIKETDSYVFAGHDVFKDTMLTTSKITLAKETQEFNFSTTTFIQADGGKDYLTGSTDKGECDVFK